jgi:hypothetical protein
MRHAAERVEGANVHKPVSRPLREESKSNNNTHPLSVPGRLVKARPSNVRCYITIEGNGSLDFLKFIFDQGVLSELVRQSAVI